MSAPVIPTYPLYGRNGTILYGSQDVPIYGGFLGELWVMTEWQFSDATYTTVAYINGVNVCNGHATSHIVDYNLGFLGSEARWSDEEHGYVLVFDMDIHKYTRWIDHGTMEQYQPYILPQETEIPCVYRCWPKKNADSVGEQSGYFGDGKIFSLIVDPTAEGAARYRIVNGDATPAGQAVQS